MLEIKAFNLSLGGWLLRFYLMMALAVALGFAGFLWLAAPVALLFAMSCIMGVTVKWKKPQYQ